MNARHFNAQLAAQIAIALQLIPEGEILDEVHASNNPRPFVLGEALQFGVMDVTIRTVNQTDDNRAYALRTYQLYKRNGTHELVLVQVESRWPEMGP